MQTQFTSHAKAQKRGNRHLTPVRAASPFPNDRPLGFTPHELRHMVAEMLG